MTPEQTEILAKIGRELLKGEAEERLAHTSLLAKVISRAIASLGR